MNTNRRRLVALFATASGVGSLGIGAFAVTRTPPAPSIEAASETIRRIDHRADSMADPSANEVVADDLSAGLQRSEGENEIDLGASPLDGVWNVDLDVGTYEYDEPNGSFVGIRVREELASIGGVSTAIRSPNVGGTVKIETGWLTEAEITVDMRALESDSEHRDVHVAEAVKSQEFPTATFFLAHPAELALLTDETGRIDGAAIGELTIAGVTRLYTVPLSAELVDEVLVVVGSISIDFSDFGVAAPTSNVALSVEQVGLLEIQLFFTRGAGDDFALRESSDQLHDH